MIVRKVKHIHFLSLGQAPSDRKIMPIIHDLGNYLSSARQRVHIHAASYREYWGVELTSPSEASTGADFKLTLNRSETFSASSLANANSSTSCFCCSYAPHSPSRNSLSLLHANRLPRRFSRALHQGLGTFS